MDKTNEVKELVVKQPSKFQQYLNRASVGAMALATGSGAFAADGYDVSAVVTNLGLAITAAATIGVTWLGFTAGISIWRNLRAAAK